MPPRTSPPVSMMAKVGAAVTGKQEITIDNTTERKLVCCISSDPNGLKISSVAVGAGAGSGNLSVSKQAKTTVVQKQGWSPHVQHTIPISDKRAYISVFALSSAGDYYILYVNRQVENLTVFSVKEDHVQSALGRTSTLP